MNDTFLKTVNAIESARLELYQVLKPTNHISAREEFIRQTELAEATENYRNLEPKFTWEEHNYLPENFSILNKAVMSSFMTLDLKRHERSVLRYLARTYRQGNELLEKAQWLRCEGVADPDDAEKYRKLNDMVFGKLSRKLFLQLMYDQTDAILLFNGWFGPNWKLKSSEPFERELWRRAHQCLSDLLLNDNGYPLVITGAAKPSRLELQRDRIPYENYMDLCKSPNQTGWLCCHFKPVLEYEFGELMKLIPEQEIYTPEEVCEIMTKIFEHPKCLGTDFRAEISDTATGLESDQVRKVLVIPRHRTAGDYTHDIMLGTVFGHEFCGHIYRRILSERRGLPFLERGLPGYDIFEEGLARLIDQTLTGKLSTTAYDHYVNAGLAEFGGYNFSEVYHIRLALHYFAACRPTDSIEKRTATYQRSQKIAFDQTVSAFGGTGFYACHKDIFYLRGDIIARRYIKHYLNHPEEEGKEGLQLLRYHELSKRLWKMGKIDCGNRKHLQIVEQFEEAMRTPLQKAIDDCCIGM